MRFFKLLLACFLLAVVVCPRLSSQDETNDERILAYDSQITLHDDGSLVVAETIKVRALGQQIIHGIYRDFPTHYKDHQGKNYNVPFDVMSVMRDGSPEPFMSKVFTTASASSSDAKARCLRQANTSIRLLIRLRARLVSSPTMMSSIGT